MKITDRDINIFWTTYEYRFPTFEQLQQIHFPSTQRAYQRLNILEAHNFLKSKEIKGHKIYRLDKDAIKLLEVRYRKNFPSDFFLKHLIAINDFRTTLSLTDSTIKLKEFKPDFNYYNYLKDSVSVSHVPDALFVLEKNSKALFFLEIDRGTENFNKIFKMLTFYVDYMQSGKFRLKYKYKVFRTLIVTNSDIRLRNIREKAKYIDCHYQYKRYIWLTVSNEIKPDNIFKNIWYSLDSNDGVKYGIN